MSVLHPAPTAEEAPSSARPLVLTVRYALPVLFVIGGIVMFIVAPTRSIGLDGLAMGLGAGLGLFVMNLLWRMGFEGDKEREAEEAARRYLGEHGHWPDED